MKFLRSQHDNDNLEHLPWVNRLPLGQARGQSGGYPAGCFYVEAYWCNNYYMRTEDTLRQSNPQLPIKSGHSGCVGFHGRLFRSAAVHEAQEGRERVLDHTIQGELA